MHCANLGIGILVVLVVQMPLAHARCVTARLVAEVREGAATRRETRMLACPAVQRGLEALPTYSWDDLARKIVWPIQNVEGSAFPTSFLLGDAKAPPVQVTMKLSRGANVQISGSPCHAHAIVLSGEASGDGVADTVAARSVTIAGDGEALLCDGEAMPRAAAMRVVRKVKPALWQAASLDEVITSEIDLAWAAVP